MTDDRQPRKRRRRRRRGGAPGAPSATGDNIGNVAVPNENASQGAGDRGFGTGRRRRARHRKRSGGGGGLPELASSGGGGSLVDVAPGEIVQVKGVLYIKPSGSGMLVDVNNNFVPTQGDPLVPRSTIERNHLDPGLLIGGTARRTGSGLEFVGLETEPERLTTRVLDLLSPIGKGQRCLVVAPPKAGKTTLLKDIAHGLNLNHPEVFLMVLLVDERPEEVTDFRRSVEKGDVIASSSDETADNHITIAEIVLDRARRLVEMKRDVVILCDSITRMSRAYNNEQRGSGKILSGGIDARTMEKPRRFFGAARNAEEWGSLTIVATALVDTGSRMDEVIFQEFKGTGNTEIVLDRGLFERRIFPAMNIAQSGTRKEEKLLSPGVLLKVHTLRRALAGTDPMNAMKMLLERLQKFPTNEAFLKSF